LLHTDRAGNLTAEFDLPDGIGRLYALFGLPEYLRIEDLFECPPVVVTSNGRELARFDPAGGLTGWLCQELKLDILGSEGKITVSMIARSDRPAVGCIRLIGFE